MRKSLDPPEVTQPAIFADAVDISDYAIDAIQIFRQFGIINGIGANAAGEIIFDPLNIATRAQVAVMLYRFITTVL